MLETTLDVRKASRCARAVHDQCASDVADWQLEAAWQFYWAVALSVKCVHVPLVCCSDVTISF